MFHVEQLSPILKMPVCQTISPKIFVDNFFVVVKKDSVEDREIINQGLKINFKSSPIVSRETKRKRNCSEICSKLAVNMG